MAHVGYQFNSPDGTNRCGLYAYINTTLIATNAGNGSRLTKFYDYHTVVDVDNGLGVGTGFYWSEDPKAGGPTGTGIFWQAVGPNTLGNYDAGSPQ